MWREWRRKWECCGGLVGIWCGGAVAFLWWLRLVIMWCELSYYMLVVSVSIFIAVIECILGVWVEKLLLLVKFIRGLFYAMSTYCAFIGYFNAPYGVLAVNGIAYFGNKV